MKLLTQCVEESSHSTCDIKYTAESCSKQVQGVNVFVEIETYDDEQWLVVYT